MERHWSMQCCPGGQAECEPANVPPWQGSQQHHRLCQQGRATAPGRCGHSLWSALVTHSWSPVSVLDSPEQGRCGCIGGCPAKGQEGAQGNLSTRECWGSWAGLAWRREHSGRPYQWVLITEGGNADGRAKLSSAVPGVRRRSKGHKPKYSKGAPALALASSQSNSPRGSKILALTLEKTSPFLTRPFPWASRQGWESSHSPCSDIQGTRLNSPKKLQQQQRERENIRKCI